MRDIVKASRRPPGISGRDRDGGLPWLSDVVAPVLRCPTSPRRARLAENHGKPSLGVFITDPWYNLRPSYHPAPALSAGAEGGTGIGMLSPIKNLQI